MDLYVWGISLEAPNPIPLLLPTLYQYVYNSRALSLKTTYAYLIVNDRMN